MAESGTPPLWWIPWALRWVQLVEDAIASWCGDIVWHFWLIRNGLEKLVELKFEFFLTLSLSLRYFGNELYNRGPNTVIAFSWRDCARFLFVGYWITHCVPCLECFLVFIVCPIMPSHQYLAPYAVLSSIYIYLYNVHGVSGESCYESKHVFPNIGYLENWCYRFWKQRVTWHANMAQSCLYC